MFERFQTLFSIETSIRDFKGTWWDIKSLVRSQLINHLDFQVSSLLQKCSSICNNNCILKGNMIYLTKFSFSPAADHWCTATREVMTVGTVMFCDAFRGGKQVLTHGICWLSCPQCRQSFLLLLTEKHAKLVSVILSIAASCILKTVPR